MNTRLTSFSTEFIYFFNLLQESNPWKTFLNFYCNHCLRIDLWAVILFAKQNYLRNLVYLFHYYYWHLIPNLHSFCSKSTIFKIIAIKSFIHWFMIRENNLDFCMRRFKDSLIIQYCLLRRKALSSFDERKLWVELPECPWC